MCVQGTGAGTDEKGTHYSGGELVLGHPLLSLM